MLALGLAVVGVFAEASAASLPIVGGVEEFRRPNDDERREILKLDCDSLGLSSSEIEELVKLTGPNGPHKLGYTFSDIRTRLIPEALAQAYPSRKINNADLTEAISRLIPSRAIHASGVTQ